MIHFIHNYNAQYVQVQHNALCNIMHCLYYHNAPVIIIHFMHDHYASVNSNRDHIKINCSNFSFVRIMSFLRDVS